MQAKTAAILSAKGIGDALLMMISAHQFYRAGYCVIFFHSQPEAIAPLFPHIEMRPYPSAHEDLVDELSAFQCVLLQNDHSERSYFLFKQREEGRLSHLIGLFPKPSSLEGEGDFLFPPTISMADNVACATAELLGLSFPKKNNGIKISPNHIYRSHPRRVLLHPSSGHPSKNWKIEKYLKLASELTKHGFQCEFVMTPEEKHHFSSLIKTFPIQDFSHLFDMANYIYESGFFIGNDSGLGHLASNMQIPTITISPSLKNMKLWRPNWFHNAVMVPKFPLPNWKGIRFPLREWIWHHCIRVSSIIKTFKKMNFRKL